MSRFDGPLRRALDTALGRIRDRYPHVIAAYEGFATPRIDGEPRIEVFMLEESELPDFLSFSGGLVAELGWFCDLDFRITGWTVAESLALFSADVVKLRRWGVRCSSVLVTADLRSDASSSDDVRAKIAQGIASGRKKADDLSNCYSFIEAADASLAMAA